MANNPETKIPVEYSKGVPVAGDVMSWNGRRFVARSFKYYSYMNFTYDGSGLSLGKDYSLGFVAFSSGEETVTLDAFMARGNVTSYIELYKRSIGSTTMTKISPTSSFHTISSTGSTVSSSPLPITLTSGDELFVRFSSASCTAYALTFYIKHISNIF
jgi:hypothetical protein